jgi:hypothetical protein
MVGRILAAVLGLLSVNASFGMPHFRLAFCCAFGQEGGKLFDPEHQRPIEYTDNGINIRLERANNRLRLAVSQRGSPVGNVWLPDDMAQVNNIERGPAGHFIIEGMLNGDSYEFAVLELTPLRLADRFWCYIGAASPNGRYIAFVKFFTLHFVQNVTDHYMLYDVTRDPKQNRPRNIGTSDVVDVGICVYPPGAGNRDGDTNNVPPGSEHIVAGELYWRNDSALFAFADRYQGELTMVVVRPNATGPPAASTAKVPVERLCSAVTKCEPRVESMQFMDKPEPIVRVNFTGLGINLARSLDFAPSNFKPSR